MHLLHIVFYITKGVTVVQKEINKVLATYLENIPSGFVLVLKSK